MKKLSKVLEDMGYQGNKYDWCIMKKKLMVNNATYPVTLMT